LNAMGQFGLLGGIKRSVVRRGESRIIRGAGVSFLNGKRKLPARGKMPTPNMAT